MPRRNGANAKKGDEIDTADACVLGGINKRTELQSIIFWYSQLELRIRMPA